MKNRKKTILLAASCICLLAVTAFGTLAYFTANGSAENRFMVAGYDPENPDKPINKDDLFSVKVEETAPDPDDPDNEKNPDGPGNIYKNITPGDTRTKDPTVVNTGKYDQWVRVKVTLTNAAAWKNAYAGITDLTTIAKGLDATKWTLDGTEPAEEDDKLVWTYYLNDKLAPEGRATLFTSVVIPAELDVEDMVALKEFKLTVAADAIQSKNTGDTAQDAFVLFDAQVNGEP